MDVLHHRSAELLRCPSGLALIIAKSSLSKRRTCKGSRFGTCWRRTSRSYWRVRGTSARSRDARIAPCSWRIWSRGGQFAAGSCHRRRSRNCGILRGPERNSGARSPSTIFACRRWSTYRGTLGGRPLLPDRRRPAVAGRIVPASRRDRRQAAVRPTSTRCSVAEDGVDSGGLGCRPPA